jgi:ubiquinone/menaquinone biosynthesis C-methylase UbiE
MGLYRERLLPHLLELSMRRPLFGAERPKCVGRLHGRVLELGFGSGLNLPHYPAAVGEVLALEPSQVARGIAARRIARAAVPVRFVDLDGQAIALEDASVDCAASTWTLCTIPDLGAALAEVRRVLRPGGALHFLEHGRSSEPPVARWQRRLTPLQKRLFGGCHLDRPIDELVEGSGLVLEQDERTTMKGPRIYTYLYRGIARRR